MLRETSLVVLEDEPEQAELRQRRLGLGEQEDEEEGDQRQDQRGEDRQAPAEERIRGAGSRRPLVERAAAGREAKASRFHLERLPVALQAIDRLHRLALDRARQGRELQLLGHALALAEAEGQELLQAGRHALAHPGLAEVVVDVDERLRG